MTVENKWPWGVDWSFGSGCNIRKKQQSGEQFIRAVKKKRKIGEYLLSIVNEVFFLCTVKQNSANKTTG